VSIVSEQPGTTTDAVVKRIEFNPIGPVTIYDTAGYDDKSSLGEKRTKATMKAIFRSDLAVLIIDHNGMNETDAFYINKLDELKVPFIVVRNKSDIIPVNKEDTDFFQKRGLPVLEYSTILNSEVRLNELKDAIAKKVAALRDVEQSILRDLVNKNDKVVLVMPIDSSAPKGRIILPQVQVLREILDANAVALCCSDKELEHTLKSLKATPELVITDSQVIDFVSKVIPEKVNLTTFSILFARYRGELTPFIEGLKALENLQETDAVLVAEACSHHAMGDDIGLVKIPKWVSEYLGFSPKFTKVNGHDFPEDLEKYKLVIHCGGCMMTRMELLRRIKECKQRGVSITNYGLLISEVNGSLDRVVRCFRT
jgi:[FeFe] hydrogenase H-cluster maturation GTPase HydF